MLKLLFHHYSQLHCYIANLVKVCRITSAVALLIGCVMAPLLGGIDQAFQFIQEYTDIVSLGILAVFLMGLFWKKTTNKAAIWGILSSIPVAVALKYFTNIPFLNQMGLTTVATILIVMLASIV